MKIQEGWPLYAEGSSTTVGIRSLTKAVLVYPTFVMRLVWRKDWTCAIDLHTEVHLGFGLEFTTFQWSVGAQANMPEDKVTYELLFQGAEDGHMDVFERSDKREGESDFVNMW